MAYGLKACSCHPLRQNMRYRTILFKNVKYTYTNVQGQIKENIAASLSPKQENLGITIFRMPYVH